MANSINELLGELQNIREDDNAKLQEWCDKLCKYYEINERHWYSEITEYILSCDGGIEYMERVIPILRHMHDSLPPDKDQFHKNINKLIDHIQLEIQRIRYINDTLQKSTLDAFIALHNEQTSQLKELYESTASEVEVVKSSAKEMEEKVKNSEKEYISILGIFSAVVLSFNGGMLFSSSVLENISNGSIFRVTLISLILGIILVNVIHLLILFIINMTRLEAERKWTYPKFMIIINVILCSMVVLVCLCWFVDIHYLATKFRDRFIYIY